MGSKRQFMVKENICGLEAASVVVCDSRKRRESMCLDLIMGEAMS